MAELDVNKLHAAAVAAHAALADALGLEDSEQRNAEAKAQKAANTRVAKLDRSTFRVPGTISTFGMPEIEWEDGTLPAETYKVGDDRMISVHPAHEELVRQHGAVRDLKGDAGRSEADDAKAIARKQAAADRKADRATGATVTEQTFPDSDPPTVIRTLKDGEPDVAYSGDVHDDAYGGGPEHRSTAQSGIALGRENPESEEQAADARTVAKTRKTKAERLAEDAETTSGPYSGEDNTANTQPSVEPGPQYAGSPELSGAPLSATEYGREPEATV